MVCVCAGGLQPAVRRRGQSGSSTASSASISPGPAPCSTAAAVP